MTAAPTRPGPWLRYRARYATLPPPVQMIGLQLWLPFVFVTAFCFCYVNAFHQPTPRHVEVAVVGSEQQVGAFARALGASTGTELSISVAGAGENVAKRVQDGDLAAAFTPGSPGTPARLTVASAAGYQIEALARQTFAAVAAAERSTLTVDDVAPLPKHDSFGTAAFYLALVWTIAGYLVAMFVGMFGVALSHRIRLGIIAGTGLLTSLLATVLAGPVVGAVHGHFFQLWLLGWSTTLAVGLVVSGLAYFLGRFVTGAALILFVFLNIPSSGGAFPASFVPEPFKGLHPFVVGTGVLDVLRSVLYDAGPGVWAGVRVLAGYAVAGALVIAVGRPWADHRARRRAELGKPGSMMLAAQAAGLAARNAEPSAVEADRDLGDNLFADEEAETDAAAAASGAGVGAGAAGGGAAG